MLVLPISSYSGDGVKDKALSNVFIREAMCTIAAERFHLYDEAKKHYKHGLEAVRQGVLAGTYKNLNNDFKASFSPSRDLMLRMSKKFNARYLAISCNFNINNFQFEQAE
tara:strand:+ start:463 stop:792 length:330 start_codon:yes stop_codon:yes gene_type:complete